MTTAVEIREMPRFRLLVRKTTCSHQEIGKAFAIAMLSVGQSLKDSGAKMKSAPVALYLGWHESDCDMAVGCEIEGDVAVADDCEWLDSPVGPHAFASHFGPYETLGKTHAEIRNWCAAHSRKISGPCWERYPVNPQSEPDSSKWQTDVHYPVEPQRRPKTPSVIAFLEEIPLETACP